MVYFLTRSHIVENNARTTCIFVGIFLSLVYGGQLADCPFIGGYMCLINHAIDCAHSCKRDCDRVPYIMVYYLDENSYYKNNARTPGPFAGIFRPLVYGGQKADCQFTVGYMCPINHTIDCEHSCKWD